MGHYTGVHIRFRVKQETEPKLLEYLSQVFSQISSSERMEIPLNFDNFKGLEVDDKSSSYISEQLVYLSSCGSEYFKNWEKRSVTLNPDGSYVFESFASVKHSNPESLVVFFDGIRESLVIKDGDILARFLYEESFQEKVIVFNGKSKSFQITDGYKHKWIEHPDVLDCPTHPRREERGDKTFIPPMNIYELFPEYKERIAVTNVRSFGARSGTLYVEAFKTVFLTEEELMKAMAASNKILTPPKKV